MVINAFSVDIDYLYPKNENIVEDFKTDITEMMRIKRNVEYSTRIDKSLRTNA